MDGKKVNVCIEGIDAPEVGQPHVIDSRTALQVLTMAGSVRVALAARNDTVGTGPSGTGMAAFWRVCMPAAPMSPC